MADQSIDNAQTRTLPETEPDWRWTLAFGAVSILGGVYAILNPFVASLAAEAVVAALFIAGGLLQIWLSVTRRDGLGQRAAGLFLGMVLVLFGVSLIFDPLAGLISLTLLVAILLLTMGLVRLWMAFRIGFHPARAWIALSGLVSVLLAGLIFYSLPEGALGLLGIFLGVELISSGIAAIMAAVELRQRSA